MRPVAFALMTVALGGCAAAGIPRPGLLPAAQAAIEDRVWLETGPAAAPGALRAFLSDGTLILGACGAPYRLAPWRRVNATILVWEEAGATRRAEIAAAGPRELALIVDPEGAATPMSFRRAEPPIACPAAPS